MIKIIVYLEFSRNWIAERSRDKDLVSLLTEAVSIYKNPEHYKFYPEINIYEQRHLIQNNFNV